MTLASFRWHHVKEGEAGASKKREKKEHGDMRTALGGQLKNVYGI